MIQKDPNTFKLSSANQFHFFIAALKHRKNWVYGAILNKLTPPTGRLRRLLTMLLISRHSSLPLSTACSLGTLLAGLTMLSQRRLRGRTGGTRLRPLYSPTNPDSGAMPVRYQPARTAFRTIRRLATVQDKLFIEAFLTAEDDSQETAAAPNEKTLRGREF